MISYGGDDLNKRKDYPLFLLFRAGVKLFSPKFNIVGEENLSDEGVLIIGNHSQMYGPIASELYCPGKHYTWCAGPMMELKQVPEYAFTDFWSYKSKWIQPFYRALSYIIAPLSVCLFNNAKTIAVWHDNRVISTFRETVRLLQEGARIVIFPEKNEQHNNIIYKFQDKFIDVARLYYRKTGNALKFVPMYLAPKLKTIYFGKPTEFDPSAPIEDERRRIKDYLMQTISELAWSLPKHTVIPYRNIKKSNYPKNTPPQFYN